MKKVLKTGSTLWIILFVISLLSAAGLSFFMLQERNKRIETEENLLATQKAKRDLEVKLDKGQLELIRIKDRVNLLTGQIEQEKRNYQQSLAEARRKDGQIKELENNLAEEKRQRTGLAGGLAQLKENYNKLERQLKQARQNVVELKGKLNKFAGWPAKANLQAGVELNKIVVKPKKELNGKVLVVNKEFHFVVVDLGKKDGVSLGDEFIVYRGSEEIGRIQVEKLYEAMATAAILPGSQQELFRENSSVKSL